MTELPPLHLFAGYGIELEYMIVDRQSLKVVPIADKLLEDMAGQPTSDVERGDAAWSNELVKHVIELKCNGPLADLVAIEKLFAAEVQYANELAEKYGVMLLPTAMHPFMNPATETVLWDEENKDIYNSYDRIFNCSGHGWSNLQSTHINLPFNGDDEFGRLHAAIRVVLPVLPAIAAASPYYEGHGTQHLDNRLVFYRNNQRSIPQIAGAIIPERAYTKAEYERLILQPTYDAIRPHDTLNILQYEWLNSRAAIARFERGAIEIRLVDIQECPLADLAIAWLATETIRGLVEGTLGDLEAGMALEPLPMRDILDGCVSRGEQALIQDTQWLAAVGMAKRPTTARSVWRTWLAAAVANSRHGCQEFGPTLNSILDRGCLAGTLKKIAGENPSHAKLLELYQELHVCLVRNQLFDR